MKDLSITREYMICILNGKGALSSCDHKAVVCMVVGGLLEMQLAKCISINQKNVSICAGLPEDMTYLKPLYNVINQGKPVKVKKVIETYAFAATNKRLHELADALMESLKEADVVEPVKAGLFGNKEGYTPKKDTVTGIVEKIRAELLEDGEISEDVVALTVLMDKAGILKDYFSKFEQKELKNRIEEIKNSAAGTLTKEMAEHIEMLDMLMMFSLISPALF